jgi:hypothetical protein
MLEGHPLFLNTTLFFTLTAEAQGKGNEALVTIELPKQVM